MSDGPTIGDWTQYEWIPDDASSFPARIRLRDAAWMVYYEPDVSDIKAENAKLRELAKGLSWCSEERYLGHQESECPLYDERTDGKCRAEALMKELGIEVDG